MNQLLLIAVIILTTGCSSLRKSKVYGSIGGALICGVIGSYIGKEKSPNKASIGFNRMVGGAAGAGVCAVGGYFVASLLYKSNPQNIEGEEIIFKNEEVKTTSSQELINQDFGDLNLSDLSMVKREGVEIPLIKSLPNSLKSKIKKQRIIKYKINPQIIKTKDGRSLYFSGGEAIEHQYEKAQ